MAKKKHIQEIDALKGWAIFLVVLGHAIIVFPINLHENLVCGTLFDTISAFHVKLFFVVSGFCFSFHGDYKSYLSKKCRRLLIPYYVFCFLEMIAKLMFSGAVNRTRSLGEFLIRTLFLGGDIWFLWTLFVIFLIFPLLHSFMRKGLAWEIGCLLGFLLIAYFRPHIDLFAIESVCQNLFWFACGVALRNHWTFDPLPGSKAIYALIAISLAVLLTVFEYHHTFSFGVREIVGGLVGVTMSFALTRFSWFNDLFARFGEYSLQLYLLNGLLLGISRIIICSVLGVTNPAMIVCFNMLVDFFLSYLLIKYVLAKIRFARVPLGMV